MSARARATAGIRCTARIGRSARPGTAASATTSPPAPPRKFSLAPRGSSGQFSLPRCGGRSGWGICASWPRPPIAAPLLPWRPWLARQSFATRRPRLSLDLSGRGRLPRLAGSLGPVAASTSPPSATRLIRRLRTRAVGPLPLRSRGRRSRDDPGQAARPSAPDRLLARAPLLLLDPLLEFAEPFFHRPLDLRPWRARLFRPDTRAIRADGFGRWVSVGRFGFDCDFRREFGHLPKS